MRKLPIARWMGEFVVIVVGVLVALGVDSWRQSRADVESEISYLRRLDADLARDSARFAFAARELAERSEALSHAREVLAGVRPEPGDPLLLLEGPRWAIVDRTPETQRTTYDELINQGALGVVSNAEIRASLGDYYGQIGNIDTSFRPRTQNLLYETDRHLMRLLPADIYAYLQRSWRWAPSDATVDPPEAPPTASDLQAVFGALRRDSEFRNLLLRAQVNQSRLGNVLAGWFGRATELRRLIEGELEQLGGG